MAEVACLHQIQRPLARIETEGWGDCSTCESNENNEHCAGYWPVQAKENGRKSTAE